MLSACAGPTMPTYKYTNNHKLDKVLEKCDSCLQIDNSKTTYKKGHKNLAISPFLGQEGYSADSVSKQSQKYEQEYYSDNCKNPVKLQRKIEVSSISYPDTCYGASYAGSVYTGATTNYYGNMATTYIHTMPVYNTTAYQCMRTLYLTNIDFYQDKTHVGSIKSEFWSEYSNIDEVVGSFTSAFLSSVKNDIRREKHNDSCVGCYNDGASVWKNIGCSLRGCDNVKM